MLQREIDPSKIQYGFHYNIIGAMVKYFMDNNNNGENNWKIKLLCPHLRDESIQKYNVSLDAVNAIYFGE